MYTVWKLESLKIVLPTGSEDSLVFEQSGAELIGVYASLLDAEFNAY